MKDKIDKSKLAVLASNRGSNFESIAKTIRDGKLDALIDILISDNENAKALKIADQFKIEKRLIKRSDYSLKKDFENEIANTILNRNIDLVVLAGFMRILSKEFLEKIKIPVINIHPSLLPKFRGLNPQAQALKAGEKVSGCSVHFVNEQVDAGKIILQAKVSIKVDDDVDSLSKRILKEEHRIYPIAIAMVLKGEVTND